VTGSVVVAGPDRAGQFLDDVDHPADAEPVDARTELVPHICFSSGTLTVPPLDSFSQ